jgi:hypothetical protein
MTVKTKNTSFSAAAATLTFDGLYARNNLDSDGSVPARPPYDLCPDIIQSTIAVSDPQTAFGSEESWMRSYDVAPAAGKNYYYVRGRNGAMDPVRADVSLYYAGSHLLMVPSVWQDNRLKTSRARNSVTVEAEPGATAVTPEPLVFNDPPELPRGHYYAFVSGNGTVPNIRDWIDLGTLLRRDLNFGFRSTSAVAASERAWNRRLTLHIPSEFRSPGDVLLTLSGSGFEGDTIGLITNLYTSEQKPVMVVPAAIDSDPFLTGVKVKLEPGYSATATVQYWNTSGARPAPGSTISLTAHYVVPPTEHARAGNAGLLDGARDQHLQRFFGNAGPQPTVILGSTTFIIQ